jgi:hypothetical protein
MATHRKIIFPILYLLFFPGCSEENVPFEKKIFVEHDCFKGEVWVEALSAGKGSFIHTRNDLSGVSDRIFTPFSIFDLQTGDINGDALTDICIGIIKPTLFDTVVKKRLFIFQIDRDYIRPLWLGSRLVFPLERFAVVKNKEGPDIIRTMERKTKDHWLIGEYKWASFGVYPNAPHFEAQSFQNALFMFTKSGLQ